MRCTLVRLTLTKRILCKRIRLGVKVEVIACPTERKSPMEHFAGLIDGVNVVAVRM